MLPRLGNICLEEYVGLPTEVNLDSEFRHRKRLIDKNMADILVLKSSETTNALNVFGEVARKGVLTIGITNVIGSV